MRRFSLPGAARFALLIAGGVALAVPALATGGHAGPGPSVSLAGASTSGGAAPSSPNVGPVIYNQYDNATPTYPYDITSQDFEDALNQFDAETADDFVVPANTTWTIDGVDADGEYRQTGSIAQGFFVRFWSNNPATGLPANMVAERVLQTYTDSTGDEAIVVNPPVPLTAGTWWVSLQARVDFNPSQQQWYWHNRAVTSNSGAAWRNPQNGHLTNCIQFSRRATCQNSTHAPDQVFSLHGTATATPPPPPPPPPPGPPPPPPLVRCHVPNVVGRSLGNAQGRIVRAHCRVGTIRFQHTSRRRRGKVIGQNPRAGRNLPRNSRVNLLVGRR